MLKDISGLIQTNLLDYLKFYSEISLDFCAKLCNLEDLGHGKTWIAHIKYSYYDVGNFFATRKGFEIE